MDREILLSPSVLFILNCIGFPLVFTVNNNFQVVLPYLSTSHNVLFSNMPAVLKSYAMTQLNKHFLSIYFSLRCCANTETIGSNGAIFLVTEELNSGCTLKSRVK